MTFNNPYYLVTKGTVENIILPPLQIKEVVLRLSIVLVKFLL
jgi:hypothetical protein